MPLIESREIRSGGKKVTLYKRECDRDDCDDVFITSRGNKVFCSDYCRVKHNSKVRYNTLKELVNQFRQEIKESKTGNGLDGICVICGKPSPTRVHPGECQELDELIDRNNARVNNR